MLLWAEVGLVHRSCLLSVTLGTPLLALTCTRLVSMTRAGLVSGRSVWLGLTHIGPGAGPAFSPQDITVSAWGGRGTGGVASEDGSHSSLEWQVVCQDCQNVPEMPLWGRSLCPQWLPSWELPCSEAQRALGAHRQAPGAALRECRVRRLPRARSPPCVGGVTQNILVNSLLDPR